MADVVPTKYGHIFSDAVDCFFGCSGCSRCRIVSEDKSYKDLIAKPYDIEVEEVVDDKQDAYSEASGMKLLEV